MKAHSPKCGVTTASATSSDGAVDGAAVDATSIFRWNATIIITSLTQAAVATMLTLRLRLPSGAEADPTTASDLYETTANFAARAAVGAALPPPRAALHL